MTGCCLDHGDFDYLAQWLRQRTGLRLDGLPPEFVSNRLALVARRFGFHSFAALIDDLHLPDAGPGLSSAVLEAFVVSDTAFFRDAEVFWALRDQTLPGLIAKRASDKTLRIWSAACASGQEVYSIAIMLADFGLLAAGWHIELIASDLSAPAVEQAAAGHYSAAEIERGLTPRHLQKYFDAAEDGWQVHADLRDLVTFRIFNLCDGFDWLGRLDIVFCRHVLMYFDLPCRCDVLAKIAGQMAPDGVLVTGSTEMVPPMTGFHNICRSAPGVYARRS